MINDRTTNKVEIGKKRKFEESSRPNKSNMFSKSSKKGSKEKWCGKCKKKNPGNCGEEVTCFKFGKHGHYANECTFIERVCYECNEAGHFKQDCRKREEDTKPKVPLKNYERCDEEVTCYMCGKKGLYANKCTSAKKVCYGCNEERHFSRDFPKKNEPAKPKAFHMILDEAEIKRED
ncbi:zinc finger protein GIS2-like [Lactuca sativa]|uniref:zinc finger protein GIS2-like n=1 Tax=Lactuca sativa TaxID=4236 RepID=UPI000CD884C2|nr:zinc finger protein GIS2-like [Lactuca sativa]